MTNRDIQPLGISQTAIVEAVSLLI